MGRGEFGLNKGIPPRSFPLIPGRAHKNVGKMWARDRPQWPRFIPVDAVVRFEPPASPKINVTSATTTTSASRSRARARSRRQRKRGTSHRQAPTSGPDFSSTSDLSTGLRSVFSIDAKEPSPNIWARVQRSALSTSYCVPALSASALGSGAFGASGLATGFCFSSLLDMLSHFLFEPRESSALKPDHTRVMRRALSP